jgi:N-acetylmuramoyl-L-alanine amidase
MACLKRRLSFIVVLSLVLGCVSRPTIPPPKKEIPLVVKIGLPLEGKVIVIDPGHGGRWRGAMGKKDFTESEINLGVALYLFGFLKENGAEVILTRTTDTEVAKGEIFELRDDLQARCEIANQAKADLFISIHHNSDWGNPERNGIQVYYQIADPGPSFDLAIEVGISLLESIGPRETEINPGNYYVLRNTNTTAILGEAAFLSYGEDEKRLSFFRSLREEARAYYQGILNYVTRGAPQIYGLTPNRQVLTYSPPEISGFIKDDEGVDPSSLRMILDGRSIAWSFDSATGKISYCPETPLANSHHSFRIQGRNIRGNAAKAGTASFTVSSPAHRITLSLSPADNTGVQEIEVVVLDKNSLPVIDGTPVEVRSERGKILNPALSTRKGKAKTYLVADSATGKAKITAHSGKISTHTEAILSQPSLPVLVVQVRNREGKPIESAEVSIGERRVFTDATGYALVELPPGNQEREQQTIRIASPGYQTLSPTIELTPGIRCREFTLEPEDDGILARTTIIVDPELMVMGIPGSYPDPERVNEENVTLARELKDWFEAAGATTHLTTEENPFPTVIDRILFSSEKKGDYFITVRHREQGCCIGYYSNSGTGEKLARFIRDSLIQTLGLAECRAIESSEFTIVQTEMPSVLITLPFSSDGVDDSKDNETLLKETQAIYQGVIQFFRSSAQTEWID